MLMFTRSEGEDFVIVIGNTVALVRIVRAEFNKVRIGVDAPESVTVFRRELWEAKQRESGKSASPTLLPPVNPPPTSRARRNRPRR